MRLSKNIKKILGIVIFIIFIFIFIKLISNRNCQDLFTTDCNYRNNICKPLQLLDVNFIINRRTSLGGYTKDLIENQKKYHNENNNYYLVIEYEQPFGSGSNPENDTDELYKIKQSDKYIWALNKGRNQLSISRKDIYSKNFRKLISTQYQKKRNWDLESINYITAFGVFNYNEIDYCILAIKNFSASSNTTKLVILNSTVRELNLDTLETLEGDLQLNQEIEGIEIVGDIHIENILNSNGSIIIYCISNQSSNANKFSLGYFQYEFETNTLISNDPTYICGDLGTNASAMVTYDNDISNIEKILKRIIYSIQDIKYYSDKYKNSNEFNYGSATSTSGTSNIKSVLQGIRSGDEFLNLDILRDAQNILDPNKINSYIRDLNIMVNHILNDKDKNGIIDFDIEQKYNFNRSNKLNFYVKTQNTITKYSKELSFINNAIQSSTPIVENNFVQNTNVITIGNGYPSSSTDNISDYQIRYGYINAINIALNEAKIQNIKIKDIDEINLRYVRDGGNNNIKVIHPKSELISNPEKKPDLEMCYRIDGNNINNIRSSISGNKNFVGVLEFDHEDIYDLDGNMAPTYYNNVNSPLIKDNIYQPRNCIFTLYRKITKKDNKKTLYGRINTTEIQEINYLGIPAFRYNYKNSTNNKLSMLSFFIKKQQNEKKFNDLTDWIYLYEVFKSQGFYYPNNNQNYAANMKNIRDSFLNNNEIMDNQRFMARHEQVFLQNDFKEVYDSEDYNTYPDFYICNEPGEDINDNGIQVKLKLKYKSEENANNDKFLKLEMYDTDPTPAISNIKRLNNKDYGMYQLQGITRTDYDTDISNDANNDKKYKWYLKKINNFDDYLELLLGEVNMNEEYDRDRLRGILELDKNFIDDKYINFLEQYKISNYNGRSQISINRFNELIEEKKRLRDLYCIFDSEGENKINKIGYPFYVFYKYIDYYGVECSSTNVDKHVQKLFLINRINENHLISRNYSEEYETDGNFELYPFIKEEFMTFTGYGNDIQFYFKQYGGATGISSSNIGNCGAEVLSYTDGCDGASLSVDDDETCSKRVLSYINTDGSARCEIDNPLVIRNNASPVETLLMGSSHVNACDVWMRKGDKKIYYRLGKIFQNSGEQRYQLGGLFTIQTTAPEHNGEYLYYDNGIEYGDTPLDEATQEIDDKYIFKAEIESDKYGSYFLFSPKNSEGSFLTQKVNIFNHRLSEWSLEGQIDTGGDINRNDRNENYKIDKEYYSQKFNLPQSLQRNVAANDGIEDDVTAEENNNFRRTQAVLNTLGTSGITRGDTTYTQEMSLEEEQRILEKELGNLNSYLKNLNNVPPKEIEDIDGLIESLKVQTEEIKERIYLGEKRLENIKFIVQASEDAKKQESSLKPIEFEKNNNLPKLNLPDNSNNTEKMNRNSNLAQQTSALGDIRSSLGNREQQPRQNQCYQVPIEEGFENFRTSLGNREQYNNTTPTNRKYNNHVVDDYHDYIKHKLNKTEQRLKDKNETVAKSLNKVSDIAKAIKLEKGERQLKLSQEIENRNKLDRDIFKIKNYEQEDRIKNIEAKLEEIEKLKCELGEIDYDKEEETQYKSIISHEDRELLNIYKINNKELGIENNNNKELNKNMILVNGGCLKYDQETMTLDSEHCMINNPQQQFGIYKIEDVNDMKKYDLKNTHNGIEKPFNIIAVNKIHQKIDNKCGKKLASHLCLHKDGDNNRLTLQNCNNIRNQKWSVSNVPKTCK